MAEPLWHADADGNGMSAWKGQQEAYPDRLSIVGGPALGLTFKEGKLALRSELYGVLWTGPEVSAFAGAWHSFVVPINFSKSHTAGYVELW